MEATLRRHDRIALAERRKRNIVNGLTFGDGCRCCYDPALDGGEYVALMELRSKIMAEEENEEPSASSGLDPDTGNGDTFGDRDGEDDSDSDDDSEFDYLLDEDLPLPSDHGMGMGMGMGDDHNSGGAVGVPVPLLSYQQERLEELQLAALIHENAIQHGFGTHRQLHPQRVLHAAGLGMGGIRGNRAAAIPPAAVIHLYQDTTMCAYLDLCLEDLTKTYKGTKFLRAEGRDTLSMNAAALVKESLPKLSMDSGIPALIAVRDGVVVAVCPNLSALGDERDGTIEPRAVEHWLDNARVLLTEVPLEFEDFCRVRPEEDALLENMLREKAKLEEMQEMMYHCGVKGCCKTFRHEHVGVKTDEQSGLVLCQDIALGTEP